MDPLKLSNSYGCCYVDVLQSIGDVHEDAALFASRSMSQMIRRAWILMAGVEVSLTEMLEALVTASSVGSTRADVLHKSVDDAGCAGIVMMEMMISK